MSSEEPPAPTVAPRRLHPAGIAVLGVGALRDLAIPLGIAFAATVFGGGGQPMTRAIVYAGIGALIAIVSGYVRWLTTRWSVGDGRIRLRTGVLSEKETDIPLGRVQAIDTVHGPLQRLFGVRGVEVQTAGGAREAEIRLPAVRPADVELLRSALRRGGGEQADAAEAPAPLAERRLSRRRLLVAALTAGQVGVLLPLLAALPQLGDEIWGGDIRSAGREGMQLVPALRARVDPRGRGPAPAYVAALDRRRGVRVRRLHDRTRRRPAPRPPWPARPARGHRAGRARAGGARRRGRPARAVRAGHRARRRSPGTRSRPPRRRCSRSCGAPRSSRSSPRCCPSSPTGSTGWTARRARALRRYVLPPAALVLLAAAVAWVVSPPAPWLLLAVIPARRVRRGALPRRGLAARGPPARGARPAARAHHGARAGGAAAGARDAPEPAAAACAACGSRAAGRRRDARPRPPSRRARGRSVV